jgi:hypothetical protein
MTWSLGAACESEVEAEVNAAIRQLAAQCGYDVFEVARRLIAERKYSVEELARLQWLIWSRHGQSALLRDGKVPGGDGAVRRSTR